MTRPRVLVVDDKDNVLNLLRSLLEDSYDVMVASDAEKALAVANQAWPDVVITDMRMPGRDGLALLHDFKRQDPDLEVVLMTAYGTVQKAVEAMKAGAYDYLTKPFEPDEALLTVARALERRSLRAQARNLRATLDAADRYQALVGKSPAMQRVFGLLHAAASSEATVVLSGEGGTGKELAARALHSAGPARELSFLFADCGALRDGAAEQLLAAAQGGAVPGPVGTLFLENVDKLPLPIQAKLIRALQERRLPSKEYAETLLSPRVVSATCIDLKAASAAGLFRADLYYLLSVVRIHMPPLRERKEDIPLLAAHFLTVQGGRDAARIEGFSADALEALIRYDWPGNIRELENAVAHAAALIDDTRIPVEALPDDVRRWDDGASLAANLAQLTYRDAVDLARDRGTREYLIALMREFGGAVTKAAERAGVERESLHRLLKRHGLRSNEFKDES